MKLFLISILIMGLFGCGGEIKSSLSKNTPGAQQDKLVINVFDLTFHRQLGSCTSLPIAHRMLSFAPIMLTPVAGDYFIGTMEVVLDELSGTYKAMYREFPSLNNTDQSQFQITLNGQFEIIKAPTDATNDKLVLENIGVVTPTIQGKTVTFILELDQQINKPLNQADVLGRVAHGATSLVDDNCLL